MIGSPPASRIWTNQTLVGGRPVLGRGDPPVKFAKVFSTWFEEQLSAPYDSVTCGADTLKSVEKTNASEPLIAHKAVPMLGSI